MLATVIRAMEPSLNEMTILELDSRSPLKAIMSGAKAYHRSFYSPSEHLGMTYADGTRCEDITRLTFADSSLDLIVSSDVLEHVPDLQAAFQESNRVLRPGGSHIFTVPTRPRTRKRAELVENTVKFLVEPEYHTDPLNPSGILAFWDFGPDAGSLFASSGLNFTIVAGPEGKDERIVWKATKSATL
jgi:SAM-dependent methyltransferase